MSAFAVGGDAMSVCLMQRRRMVILVTSPCEGSEWGRYSQGRILTGPRLRGLSPWKHRSISGRARSAGKAAAINPVSTWYLRLSVLMPAGYLGRRQCALVLDGAGWAKL